MDTYKRVRTQERPAIETGAAVGLVHDRVVAAPKRSLILPVHGGADWAGKPVRWVEPLRAVRVERRGVVVQLGARPTCRARWRDALREDVPFPLFRARQLDGDALVGLVECVEPPGARRHHDRNLLRLVGPVQRQAVGEQRVHLRAHAASASRPSRAWDRCVRRGTLARRCARTRRSAARSFG